MSHTLDEHDVFALPNTIPVPNLGDRTYPNVVPQAVQALTDRTRNLTNTLQGVDGGAFGLATESGVPKLGVSDNFLFPPTDRAGGFRQALEVIAGKIAGLRQNLWTGGSGNRFMAVPVEPFVETNGAGGSGPVGTNWLPQFGTGVGPAHYQKVVTSAVQLAWAVKGLPPTGKIIEFACSIRGFPGTHSAMPATKPKLSFYRQPITGVPQLVGSIQDATTAVGSYEQDHTIFVTNLSEQIADNVYYIFVLDGEAGVNAQANLRVTTSFVAVGA